MTNVVVVLGAGVIGQAIARRVGAGAHVLLADLRMQTAETAASVLSDAGFVVSTATVDVSSRVSVQTLVDLAQSIGDVSCVVHAAGVSPTPAAPAATLCGRPLWHRAGA